MRTYLDRFILAIVLIFLNQPISLAIPEKSDIKVRQTFQEALVNAPKANDIIESKTKGLPSAKQAVNDVKVTDPSVDKISNAANPTPKADKTTKESTKTTSASKTASSSTAQASSSGPGGSVPMNVQASSVNVEPFSGSANLAFPIQVPPGRAGIQPNLALTYSSSNRQLGNAGVGWNLDLGSIQRSTKKGVPKYDSSDTFVLAQGSAQNLVYDNQAGFYRTEIEGGFAKTVQNANGWVVTDKKGVKYYFGYTDNSRQYDPTNTSHIFRWGLNKVEDVNGNYMTIRYRKEGNQLYPDLIEYTGNSLVAPNEPPRMSVFIGYGFNAHPNTSYIQGFGTSNTRRIEYMRISADGNLQNFYYFNYKLSADTGRDLLQSIVQTGADGLQNLPPVTFSYNEEVSQFQLASGWNIPSEFKFIDFGTNSYPFYQNIIDHGVRALDINGDGHTDFIKLEGYCDQTMASIGNIPTRRSVYLNDKNRSWFYDATYSNNDIDGYVRNTSSPIVDGPSLSTLFIAYEDDLGLRSLDINSDGYLDFFQSYQINYPFSQSYLFKNVWINQGNSIIKNTEWALPDIFISKQVVGVSMVRPPPNSFTVYHTNSQINNLDFADVNADGYPDLVYSKPSGANQIYLNQMLQNNKTWLLTNQMSLPDGVADIDNGTFMVDVNGDGLTDILRLTSGSSYFYYNTGNGWVQDNNSPWIQGIPDADFKAGSTLIDINGDGFLDLVVTNSSSDPKTYINTGNGWFTDSSWSLPGARITDKSTQFLDANGDGMIDYMIYNTSTPQLYLNPGSTPSDVLVSVNNGIGATTRVSYDSSAHYSNTFMPFITQVVKSVTTTVANPAGAPSTYTTSYDYAGGLWDKNYREFNGFRMVKVIDADGNYTQTTFAQDHYTKGRPLEQASYDASGKLYAKSVNQWATQDIATDNGQTAKFVFLQRTDNFIFDGAATPRRTAQEFTYGENPQYGDPTQALNYGEVDPVTGNDIGQDRIISQNEYTHNLSPWVIGLPKHALTKEANGSILSQTWYYYDGATDVNAAPTLGRLTKKKDWLSDDPGVSNPHTTYTYDDYGNIKSTTDAMNNTMTIIYDATYRMFPVQTINALNHVSKTYYYGVNEGEIISDPAYTSRLKGLWGQVLAVADANNQKAFKHYDALGRSLKSYGPLDNFDFPSSETIYSEAANYTKVMTKSRVEHLQSPTIDNVSYYDGLGRLIETKTQGALSGQFVVSGQSEYNNRGLVVKLYRPRFTANSLDVIDAIDTDQPVSQAIYDAMGRAIKSINADGSYSNVIYDRWTSTTYDANGHMQKSYSDAFGRLIIKEEYLGADGRAPDYPANAYSLYATTNYTHDLKGNLIFVTDAHRNITSITYDKLGRKIAMDDPDMGHWEYAYDLNGNLIAQKDAKNQAIVFQYDALNRLKNKTDGITAGLLPQWPSVLVRPASFNVTYHYGEAAQSYGKGRLTSVAYKGGGASFVYDQLGREQQSIKTVDGISYTVFRMYDALNRLKQLQYPDGQKVNYTYNAAGQVKAVADEGGASGPAGMSAYVSHVTYNALGQMTQIEYGNGVISSYTYHPQTAQLTRLYSSNTQAEKLQDLNYTYDALGQITQIQDNVNTATQTFQYDALNRLVRAQGAQYGTKIYAYDEIGNILQKDGLTYYYSGSDSGGPHALKGLSDGTTFGYDANGNMISEFRSSEQSTFGYDVQNRLIGVMKYPAHDRFFIAGRYSYDGDGGRTRKIAGRQIPSGYNTQEPVFFRKSLLWMPETPVVKTMTRYVGQVYEEDVAMADGQVNRRTKFIYLGSQRVAAVTGANAMFYHTDHLGGTNVLSDSLGAVRELTEYEPFGAFSKHEKYGSDFSTAWYYFTGKPLDDETGLMYFGARYYNPKLGRFITPDTIVQSPGNPQTLNRYTYCNNNPVNNIDPTGHSWWKKFWGGVKDFVRDYGGLFGLSGGLANGIINNNWKPLQNQLIAGASAFVLSGFNPVAGMAAMMTTSFLDSKPGQQVTKFVASEVMDDMLGMRPGTALVWARIGLQIAGTLAVENMMSSMMGQPIDPSKTAKYDSNDPVQKAMTNNPKGYGGSGGRTPGGLGVKGFKDDQMWALTVKGQSQPTVIMGKVTFGLNELHTSAVSSTFSGIGGGSLPLGIGSSMNPLTGYGTFFGVCQQVTNATLLASGVSSTVWDVASGWSTMATTLVYGNYGGQLSNYVYTGISTDRNYDKNV